MKRLVFDLDETICFTKDGDYTNALPNLPLVAKLREFRLQGFEIIISTARSMRTYHGNTGKINANTLPVILDWLNRNDVPYDEIYTGKPWCGTEGFYIDDRSIRPNEFILLSYSEIISLITPAVSQPAPELLKK